MALLAGTVGTVDADTGAPVSGGSGFALAYWNDVILAVRLADFPASDIKTSLIAGFKVEVDAMAASLLGYVTAHAAVAVTIGTGDSGLQRMPASTAENTSCKAPASPKTLSGTIS